MSTDTTDKDVFKTTYCFDAFAVHFVIFVSSGKVESSIAFLTDQEIRKIDLNMDVILCQRLGLFIRENYFFEFQFDGVGKLV